MADAVLYKGPEGEALRFYTDTVKNEYQSELNARPLFDEVLYVEVISPGSRESAPVFELERKYCAETGITEPQRNERYTKYKAQIEAHRAGVESGELSGTPLSVWPAVDGPTVASLKEARVFTVEGLASISDEKLRVLGPQGRLLREKAQTFLDAAAGNAPIERLTAENVQLREQLVAMQQQINNLTAPAVDTAPAATNPSKAKAATPAVEPAKAGEMPPII